MGAPPPRRLTPRDRTRQWRARKSYQKEFMPKVFDLDKTCVKPVRGGEVIVWKGTDPRAGPRLDHCGAVLTE